jgi:Na+-translocating ferredoxin:NAD+ oxidoreductase RnfC subunit
VSDLVQTLQSTGVVGAGGAGFPTYKKLEARVEIVIANGAECEPLLFKDQILMETYPREILGGMIEAMNCTGAGQGIVAIKGKNRRAIETISAHLPANIRIFEMEDVYPAGDEYEVVYHSTGRRIPAGGLPLEVGIVVQNVETLYNIHCAVEGHPVTHSMMTIHGHVREPLTAWFPIGMNYRDALEVAGGATIDDFVLIDGGPMMGKVVTDLATPVTRTTSGLLVMPRESKLAIRKSQPEAAYKRFGKSACDQCSLCTEMCPRYLLGYPIKPHLVMRSLLTTGELSESLTFWAQACCECNICTLWACPEDLDPRNVCVVTKRDLKKNNQWLPPAQLQKLTQEVHPIKKYRSVPTQRLTRRLGLDKFTQKAPLFTDAIAPKSVAIPLQQHAGAPAVAVVREGDRVEAGSVIAKAAEGQLSVAVHASISGIVKSVGKSIVIEKG